MRVLTTVAVPPSTLNEKGALTYENEKSNGLANLYPTSEPTNVDIDNTKVRQRDIGETLPYQKLGRDSLKAVVLIHPKLGVPEHFKLRHRFTQLELSQALAAANVSCFKKEKLPLLSLTLAAIPNNIKEKIAEVEKQFGSIRRFIDRLPSLLTKEDLKRVEEPFQEFDTRLEDIKKALTRAQCLENLKGVRESIETLDILLSDLVTTSTNLSPSPLPDVQKTGFRLAVSALIWGGVSSALSLAATLLLVPGNIPIIASLAFGIGFGYFRYQNLSQENAHQDKEEQLKQASAPLLRIQEEIKDLHGQIKQLEEGFMEKLVNHINQLTQQVNNLNDSHTQTGGLAQMLQFMQQQMDQQAREITELKAHRARENTSVTFKNQSTQTKAEDINPNIEDATVMKRVA